MLHCVLIDDEAPARRIIREYLREFPMMKIVAEAENGPKGVAAIVEHRPDVIFLDIQMPLLNGFEVLELARREGAPLPAVVFSTAFDSFALEAFEVNAVDYLLKPYSRERFRTGVARILQRREGTVRDLERLLELVATTAPHRLRREPSEYLMIRSGGKVIPIRMFDVEWIEAADNYVVLHLEDASHIGSIGIGEIEKRLDPRTFLRVHRSAIVNITLVRHVEPDGDGGMIATMNSGASVKVSRSHASEIRKLFI